MSRSQLQRLAVLALVCVGALLEGCGSLQPEVVKAQTQGKSIAVAALLGPKLKLQWIGTTAFNNEYGEIAPQEWSPDALAEGVAVDALRAAGRYASVNGVAGARRGADGALALPGGTQADFVVAIAHRGHGDPLFGTNQNLQGIGVVQRTFMGLSRTEIFCAIEVALYDGAGKSLGSMSQFAHQPAGFRLLSGSGSAQDMPSVADADMATFRDKLQASLRQAVERALAEAGLR